MDFTSNAGLSTKTWGPSGWNFLFSCIMGAYPVEIDITDEEHLLTMNNFKNMFKSLSYTMPCIYCRESYKIFITEIPIDNFLDGRINLMRWLYIIKDKVNNKLINQEWKCFLDEKKILDNLYKNNRISGEKYGILLLKKRNEILISTPSPSFSEVLQKYESKRAKCNSKSKKCQ